MRRQIARVRRRRRHGLIPKRVEHPRGPAHGQRARAVGQIGQDARHAEDAAAAIICRRGNAAEIVALHALDAIMLRHPLIDDQEVAVEKIGDRQILLQHHVAKLQRLLPGAVAQRIVVVLVEIAVRRMCRCQNCARSSHCPAKLRTNSQAFGIGDHPLHLRPQNGGIVQLALRSHAIQLPVRRAAPQQIGKPARKLPPIHGLRTGQRLLPATLAGIASLPR